MKNLTEEELNLLFDKFEDRLVQLFGDEFESGAKEGFDSFLEGNDNIGSMAPTREFKLEYEFDAWLMEHE